MKKIFFILALYLPLSLLAGGRGTVTGFADFLLWKANEENLDYAEWSFFGAQPPTAPSLLPRAADSGAHYAPGYRLGLSYARCSDISVYWTHYSSTATSVLPARPGMGIIPLFPVSNSGHPFVNTGGSARTTWKLNYNIADLEVGHVMRKREVQFRPHLGVRVAWIHQNVNALYTPIIFPFSPTVSVGNLLSKNNNHFCGGGLRIGGDGSWNFWRGFSLFGKSGLSLLYGKFNVLRREFFVTPMTAGAVAFPPGTQRDAAAMRFYGMSPAADLTGGMSWCGRCSCVEVKISLAWECQIWWSQNRGYQSTNPTFNGVSSSVPFTGHLTLQGLTARFGIGF
ncbi:MAG: hypothetical protein JSR80_06340 [Verrucomicrobia bacterium]|nr:hypothetical protein [Verrucomicrobiota bacterium]